MLIVFSMNGNGTYNVFDTSGSKGYVYNKEKLRAEKANIVNIKEMNGRICGDGFDIAKLRAYKVQVYSIMQGASKKFRCIDTNGNVKVVTEDMLSAFYWSGKALNYRMYDKGIVIMSKYVTKETVSNITAYIHEDYISMYKEYWDNGLISTEAMIENLNIQGFINRKLTESTINGFMIVISVYLRCLGIQR